MIFLLRVRHPLFFPPRKSKSQHFMWTGGSSSCMESFLIFTNIFVWIYQSKADFRCWKTQFVCFFGLGFKTLNAMCLTNSSTSSSKLKEHLPKPMLVHRLRNRHNTQNMQHMENMHNMQSMKNVYNMKINERFRRCKICRTCRICKTKPAKPNQPSQTCQTKPTKPNLSGQTLETKPNIPNQAKQNKPNKPNIPSQAKLS